MLELTFNTRILRGLELLANDEVIPIIDFDGIRYLINTTFVNQGSIKWTPYDLPTQTVIGDITYSYTFAAHNTFKDAIFGPRNWPQPLIDATFPAFPTPNPDGTVIP